MRQAKKRSLLPLLTSIASLAALGYLILSNPPSGMLHISAYSFPTIDLFFVLLFFFLFFLVSFLFKAKRHGILISLLVIAYLLLRLNHLNNLFFGILLLSLFLVLELLFGRQK